MHAHVQPRAEVEAVASVAVPATDGPLYSCRRVHNQQIMNMIMIRSDAAVKVEVALLQRGM